uniref:Abnormal cell migration protein 18-like fibronectin type I domain-containing protein n=1 Tax=Romanomermis culicivorax TaxID=13658 RepID=A0A915L333_ROMCU
MYHFGFILLLSCLWSSILSLFFKRELDDIVPPNDDGSLWLNTVFKNHKKSDMDFQIQRHPNGNVVPMFHSTCTESVERTMGPIVFTCTNGREQISHCLSADSYGNKIRIKIVRLQPVACIHDGQIYQPGSRFTDRATQTHAFFYVCERTTSPNGGGVHVRSGGCVDDNGEFLTGGYFNWQGRRMMCQTNSDGSIIAQSARR